MAAGIAAALRLLVELAISAVDFVMLLRLQAEGQDFALRSPERLWALVNFKSGPTHLGATDVVIRMNYTTVPRTWVPVNKWKRHLSVRRSPGLQVGLLISVLLAVCIPEHGVTIDTWAWEAI